MVPVDGRGSFCVGCRRINPDWPQASALTRDLEQAINGTKYQEPTQEMVSPTTLLLWQSRAQSRCRCGREPSPVADVGRGEPSQRRLRSSMAFATARARVAQTGPCSTYFRRYTGADHTRDLRLAAEELLCHAPCSDLPRRRAQSRRRCGRGAATESRASAQRLPCFPWPSYTPKRSAAVEPMRSGSVNVSCGTRVSWMLTCASPIPSCPALPRPVPLAHTQAVCNGHSRSAQ